MKKLYFVFVLILLVSPIMAQIPSYVPKDGLVGYWPFNGNANDESGNGNHGTNNGATLTTDRNGIENSAYSFDGANTSKITVTDNLSLRPKNFTIIAWISVSNSTMWNNVVSKRINSNNTNSYSLFEGGGNFGEKKDYETYDVVTNLDGTQITTLDEIQNNVGIQLNTWNLLIGSYDGNYLRFYINGELIRIKSATGQIQYSDDPLFIGTCGYQGDGQNFIGKIDDVFLYNRALTEQEITALYTGSPCAAQITHVLQPTCFFKTGQIELKAYTGNAYSYSLDGKNYTSDTTFRELAPGAYTVFVKHTSGCTDSTSVTIQPVPTSLTATTSQVGSVKICAESSMLVSAIAGRNYTYQWYKDNTLLQDSISKNLTVSKAGKYSVFISDGACSDTSDYLVLDTIPLPDAPIVNNNYIRLCDKNTNLQSIIQNNQINPSYRWYRSETGTDSIPKQQWLPNGMGGMMMNYYLSQFSATNPACESKKRTMLMVEDKTPPNINYPSSTTLCPGDSIELKVYNMNNSWELEWKKDWMQLPNSQGKTSIFVKEAGRYSVYNRQCMNNYIQGENSIQIDMQTVSIQEFSNYVLKNEAPITLLGNPTGGVFSGAGVTNAVFDPSALKLGKTRIKYNYVSPSGCAGEALKQVIVVDSLGTGGCTQIKYDTVTVKNNVYDTVLKFTFKLTTGIQANQMASMLVYPNPTSDVLLLEVTDLEAVKGYRYRILDISGKEVYTGLITEQKTAVSLKTFGAGVYVLHIIDGNNTSIETKQIVLE